MKHKICKKNFFFDIFSMDSFMRFCSVTLKFGFLASSPGSSYSRSHGGDQPGDDYPRRGYSGGPPLQERGGGYYDDRTSPAAGYAAGRHGGVGGGTNGRSYPQ